MSLRGTISLATAYADLSALHNAVGKLYMNKTWWNAEVDQLHAMLVNIEQASASSDVVTELQVWVAQKADLEQRLLVAHSQQTLFLAVTTGAVAATVGYAVLRKRSPRIQRPFLWSAGLGAAAGTATFLVAKS